MTTDIPGFVDPVADAQACFRALLEAMAHPGRIMHAADLQGPVPLAPATSAVLLTLADMETAVWLDRDAGAATGWVRFHCGARISSPGQAVFAVCLEFPSLTQFEWGTHEAPEASTTVILQRPSFDAGPWSRLSGPGLREPVDVRLGLPEDFAEVWRANHAAFPRGMDLIVCCGGHIAALPRTTNVELV